jgi:hypothetical protein
MKNITALIILGLSLIACSDDSGDCQTCTKTIGGVAGNSIEEVKEVCNSTEANNLEASSSGTTVWTCE